jgi:hypothetical protein
MRFESEYLTLDLAVALGTGRVVQVDSIRTRSESAYGFSVKPEFHEQLSMV